MIDGLEHLDFATVASRCGMSCHARRWGPCQVCGADKMPDGRPPVHPGHRMWFANCCDANGDWPDLASYHLLGKSGRDAGPDFRRVVDWLRGTDATAPVQREEPTRAAPTEEIMYLMRVFPRVDQDEECSGYLRGRGIEPAGLPAVAVPRDFETDWWPLGWSATWRIMVPSWSGTCKAISVHARACSGAQPKTRNPRGLSSSGVLFADASARRLLRGDGYGRILLVEGISDYLQAWAHFRRMEPDLSVIGTISGSAAAFGVARLDPRCSMAVAMDPDLQGEKYKEAITEAVFPISPVGVPLWAMLQRSL